MVEFELLIGVLAMFFVRIGIPLLVLIVLGVIVDRWQTKREEEFNQMNDNIRNGTLQRELQS